MRVDILHRKITRDAMVMYAAVSKILPAQMPSRYEGHMVNIQNFVKRLNVATEPLGFFHEIAWDKTIKPGDVFQSGLWLYKDDLPENGSTADIRLLWHLHPDTKRIILTQAEWARRRFYFWMLLLHELIHRYQETYRAPETDIKIYNPRSTQRDSKEAQLYYGNCDEIEAHSHNAAVELLYWWGHLDFRAAIREALSYNGRVLTPTYNMYDVTFIDTLGHPAMKHFKRKLRQWYNEIKKNPDLYTTLELPNLVT